ncbi:MAG: tetratricopeptide repeat protein, partial [Xenococcaceae cyanobacterium MO_188.B19]|nr:tetratricopeptide repeat protein [Xenococcaceae cyanobacterium MO_188.B19]
MKQTKKILLLLTTFTLVLSNPKLNNVSATEQEAQQLYEQNRYSEAINILQKDIKNYQQSGDIIGNAIATRNLALIYHKLGNWEQAETTLAEAENIINNLENKSAKSQLLAQILEVRGQIELSLGRSQQALETWQQATSLYEQQENITGFTQSKIYQAYALQALGLYSQSIKTLTDINNQLKTEPDNLIKAQALLNTGNVLNRIGKYKVAKTVLESSLNIAEKINNKAIIADTFLSLGNNARFQEQLEP